MYPFFTSMYPFYYNCCSDLSRTFFVYSSPLIISFLQLLFERKEEGNSFSRAALGGYLPFVEVYTVLHDR